MSWRATLTLLLLAGAVGFCVSGGTRVVTPSAAEAADTLPAASCAVTV